MNKNAMPFIFFILIYILVIHISYHFYILILLYINTQLVLRKCMCAVWYVRYVLNSK